MPYYPLFMRSLSTSTMITSISGLMRSYRSYNEHIMNIYRYVCIKFMEYVLMLIVYVKFNTCCYCCSFDDDDDDDGDDDDDDDDDDVNTVLGTE